MILCEFTPEGEDMIRMGMDDYPLNYLWKDFIDSFSSFRVSMEKDTGGRIKPEFTDITIKQSAFSGILPRKASVVLKATETTEDDAVTLFSGTAFMTDFSRDGYKFVFLDDEYDALVSASTVYTSVTLNDVMGTLCGASYLNVSLNTTKAKSPSPAVEYTVPSDILAINLASELCAFFSHAFRIINGTLYLIDIDPASASVDQVVTEFEVQPTKYTYDMPVSMYEAGDYNILGTYAVGDVDSVSPVFHDTEANIVTALEVRRSIKEAVKFDTTFFFEETMPSILDVISLLDESMETSITCVARLTSLVYNFGTRLVSAEGFGTIT